jgi:hypothetical protein
MGRYQGGADIDWAQVAKDLLLITGGSLGSVGAGVVGIVGSFLGIGGWAIDYWVKDGSR